VERARRQTGDKSTGASDSLGRVRGGLAMAGGSCIVIKVGGSLYDLPDLRTHLRALLSHLDSHRVVLFPGGGAAADVVRELDRVHELGEDPAHWLALRALTMNAFFLHELLPEVPVAIWPDVPDKAILEPFAFAVADEMKADHLPHAWSVTSDSLAARAAYLLGARELILLKSSPLSECLTWSGAADRGLVDAYFPKLVQQTEGLAVRVINMRAQGVARTLEPCPRQ
jgi:hypothetical protein